jgi:hypothetical protein
VVSEAPEGDSGSRRQVLSRTASAAAAATGAALLAACGGESLRSQLKRDPPVAHADVIILKRLLEVERLGIAAYTAGAPLLPPSAADAAKQFLAQELAHAGGLGGLIKAAGAKPPEPRGNYDLGKPRDARDVLRLFETAERLQIAAYVEAIPRLAPGQVRTQTAGYFANDAQHLSSVRLLLGEPPLPAALVTGRE